MKDVNSKNTTNILTNVERGSYIYTRRPPFSSPRTIGVFSQPATTNDNRGYTSTVKHIKCIK